jgi:hypothetical protein
MVTSTTMTGHLAGIVIDPEVAGTGTIRFAVLRIPA